MKVYKRSPRRVKVCKGRPVAGVGKHTISLYCAPLREHTISLYCAPLQESVNTHTQVYRPRHYKSTMPRGAPPGNKNGATAHKVAICDNTRIATAASSPAVVNVLRRSMPAMCRCSFDRFLFHCRCIGLQRLCYRR
jgi:hypothetical protein